MSQSENGYDWGGLWGKVEDTAFRVLDWTIDDKLGAGGEYFNPDMLPGFYDSELYSERTPPAASNPVEQGFEFGNNPMTWGMGVGVLAIIGLIAVAVKK